MFRRNITMKIITGAYVKGKWVDSVSEEVTIRASVQPLKGKELETLSEGRRVSESYKLFTNDTLKIEAPNDQVELFGNQFEVVKKDMWTNNIINHTELVVMRFEGSE